MSHDPREDSRTLRDDDESQAHARPEQRARDPLALAPGVVINRNYRLHRRLGKGAMGEVWLAHQLNWHEHAIAIKFLHAATASNQQFVKALSTEAEVMLSLFHDGIVRLHILDTTHDVPFLVMEYLAGPTLAQISKQRASAGTRGLNADEAIWLVEQLAPALAYAHGKGVAHRDIKPANILLDTQPGETLGAPLRAKLVDFGVALRVSSETTYRLAGTPPYMAPELLGQRKLTTDGFIAADVYALAATIHHLVSGSPPFRFTADFDELALLIANERPAPLDSGHAGLDRAVRAALSKSPHERPASALEFRRWIDADRVTSTSARATGEPELGASGTRAEPRLFVLQGARFDVEQNHVLHLGVMNPGEEALDGWLQVDALRPEGLSIFNPERCLNLAPHGEAWAAIGLRAHERGRSEIAIRLHLRGRSGRDPMYTWEVPAGHVFVEVEDAKTGGLTVGPGARREDSFRGRDRESLGRVHRGLMEAGGHDEWQIQQLRVDRPDSAWGVMEWSKGCLRERHVRVDVARDGELVRRIHVLFARKCSLGRIAQVRSSENAGARQRELVLCWLPCRSRALDPENYDRNVAISRHAGDLTLDEWGSRILSTSLNVYADGAPLAQGANLTLRSRQAQRVGLGLESKALELELTAHKPARAERELCRLLQRSPNNTTTFSSELENATYHHAVRVRRLANAPRIEYVVASPWMRIGGGEHDTARVEGLRPGLLTLAQSGYGVYALFDQQALGASVVAAQERLWAPLRDGDCIACDEWTLRISAAKSSDMAEEQDGALAPA